VDKHFLSLISKTLDIPPEVLKYDSTTETVPQWTSLSHWEVIEAIETNII
jgi:hypothetical protein